MSTKGLGVFNAIRQSGGELPPEAILSKLTAWRADVTEEYVSHGVAYLVAKGYATVKESGAVAIPAGARLKRGSGDMELVLV